MGMTKTNIELPKILIDYQTYMKNKKNRSDNTIKVYTLDIIWLLRYVKKENSQTQKDLKYITIDDINASFLNNITEENLSDYIDYLAEEKNNAPKSRARKITAIRMFFKYLYDKVHVIDDNVSAILENPKIDKVLPEFLTEEESVKLLDVVYNKEKIIDICIIVFFLNLGLRLSELINIRFSDLKGNDLKIIGKGSKERHVYLNDECIYILNKYKTIRNTLIAESEEDEDILFLSSHYRKMNPKTVENMVKKYLIMAGFDDSKLHVHSLRHSYLTRMYQTGNIDLLELAQIAGHESLDTTKIYLHTSNEAIKKAMLNNGSLGNIRRLGR